MIKNIQSKEAKEKNSSRRLLRSLRGMRDILPQDEMYFDFILKKAQALALSYGYEHMSTPVLEETSLFLRSLGKTTDVIERELFSFVDKNGDKVALRPEFTASIVRSYIEHGMFNFPQPVKFFTFGSLFRHDRPQAGRFREFRQIDFEILGTQAPVSDAELMDIGSALLKECGISFSLQINSLGCASCRPNYRTVLLNYFRGIKNKLCVNCQKRYLKNPFRLLDCKESSCRALSQDVPPIMDHLCEECKKHFTKVLEHLDDAEIPYSLNHRIVRGLDYYTKTAFEFLPVVEGEEDMSSQSALGGGGRYDDLTALLGGRPTPASGFALGVDRIMLAMKMKNVVPPDVSAPEIFLAQLGETARHKALKFLEDLRSAGFRVRANLVKDSLSQQLALADKLKVTFTIILGQKEVLDKTIIIREMLSGSQEIVDFQKVIPELRKRLKRT